MLRIFDSESISVTDVAVGISAAKITNDVDTVWVSSEGNIRFWTSGKKPTNSTGIPMYDGAERQFGVNEAAYFWAIRKDNENATIHIQYGASK